MNKFEAMGSGAEHIGDFAVGSKGGGSQELVQQESARNEKVMQSYDALIAQLDGGDCKVLASYMKALTHDQIVKIDAGLDFQGKGIFDLKWVEPTQQDEVMGLLEEINQAQDPEAVKNASNRIVGIVG